jgi:PAS domain S-box-containing protein
LFFSSSQERNWDDRLLTELQMMAGIMGSGLERARARLALARSEQLNTAILSSLPSFVTVLDVEGNITAVNSSMASSTAAAFGADALRPGVNYFEICGQAARAGLQFAQTMLQGLLAVRAGGSSRFEMEYPSQERWFHVSAVPLIGKQRGVVVSHIEVTRRKLAELEVQESEKRFRLMADSAPMLVWMSGPDGTFSDFNQGWLEFTGKRKEEEVGEGWKRGIHPEDADKFSRIFKSAFDSRQPFRIECRLQRCDGQYRWMMGRGVPRFRDDGTLAGYIGSCSDLTEQKEAELARSEISGRLIRAQEEERARIARELHDDINQKLGLLAIEIQQLGQQLPPDAPAQNGLAALFDKANHISRDVQLLSHQLHSSRLDYLGLPAALRRLCEEFSAQHHIFTECAIKELPPGVTREINLCLFRVAQECLSNTAKHGHARHARVELHYDDAIRMKVSDDGNGFDPAQAGSRQEPGLGMISMRERLRLIHGELVIHSQPGSGTDITAVVPVKNQGNAGNNAGVNGLKIAG